MRQDLAMPYSRIWIISVGENKLTESQQPKDSFQIFILDITLGTKELPSIAPCTEL